MKRAKRILLMAVVLVVSLDAHASIWNRRKADRPAEKAQAAGTSLAAIEADASRVVLRTSATPAYTSYSPAPDVFVVDLTGTGKDAGLTIPRTLPAGLASISAEEAVEMGTRLTRVTFRLTAPASLQASAHDNSVVVALPVVAGAAPAVTEVRTPIEIIEAPAPGAEPVAELVAEPIVEREPLVETIAHPEPVAHLEPVSLPKAKSVKKIETAGSGPSLEVKIAGDGALTYKAFRLENPSRLVIDLTGVKNAVKTPNLDVAGAVVKRVRVAQFQSAPNPVTRVVVDLAGKPEYHITKDGSQLRVSFGNAPPLVQTAAASPIPIEVEPMMPAPKPATKPARTAVTVTAPSDIPSQVPVVAEEASSWRMPETKGAKGVINAPAGQTPPETTGRARQRVVSAQEQQENVFNEEEEAAAAQQQELAEGGTRTLSGTSQRVFTGEPISLNLKDADIKDVLRTFAQLTGLNIAVDPQVGGSVTVDFVEVPWDQALDLILRQNGLAFTIEGNVMRVGTVERLAQEAQAQRRIAEEERLNVPTSTVSFKLSYARANEVAGLLREIASPRARIIVDQRTNQIIISEIPQYLQTIRNLIESVDVPTRQVLIETRIVEVTKNFQQSYGFEWGFDGALDPALGTGTGLIFPNRVGVVGGPFNFGPGNPVLAFTLTDVLGAFNLDFALNASEFEGLSKVISAPKVMTQDNTPAEIQSGFQIPYQTRVNFTTMISYVDATLRLSVTPQITEAGTIIMDIAVQKNEPTTGVAVEGASGTPLSTRQARTRLMVRDGGTAVIGGIYQVKDNNSQTRLPFLHAIPVIGALFRTHNVSTTHDELLIFITPRIVRGV